MALDVLHDMHAAESYGLIPKICTDAFKFDIKCMFLRSNESVNLLWLALHHLSPSSSNTGTHHECHWMSLPCSWGVRGGGCGWSPVVSSTYVDCYFLVWHMPSTTLSKRNQIRRMKWPRRTRWLAADSLTSRSPVASWALVTGGRSPGSWSLETQYPASYLSPSPSCVILPTLSWLLSARIPPLKSVLNCQRMVKNNGIAIYPSLSSCMI